MLAGDHSGASSLPEFRQDRAAFGVSRRRSPQQRASGGRELSARELVVHDDHVHDCGPRRAVACHRKACGGMARSAESARLRGDVRSLLMGRRATSAGWLADGRGLNIAHEAVDRHAIGPRANRAHQLDRQDGTRRDITYVDLRDETSRFANVLSTSASAAARSLRRSADAFRRSTSPRSAR